MAYLDPFIILRFRLLNFHRLTHVGTEKYFFLTGKNFCQREEMRRNGERIFREQSYMIAVKDELNKAAALNLTDLQDRVRWEI